MQFNGPVLELLRPGALALHPVLGRLGPDVLDDDFDAGRAARNAILAAEDRAVAEVLLDQRVACGIGNIAKSEGLWSARANPFASPQELGEERLTKVYLAAAGWLAPAVRARGPRAVPRLRPARLPALRPADIEARAGRRRPHDVVVPRLPGSGTCSNGSVSASPVRGNPD